MAKHKVPSDDKPDLGKRVSVKTAKATAAAEAKKTKKAVTQGEKKCSRAKDVAKKKGKGPVVMLDVSEKSESDDEEDEKVKIVYAPS